MRLLLVGNYGAGNVGDELLREYFPQRFPEMQWITVSASPTKESHDVPRLPCGFRSFFLTPWWRTVRAYWRADGVVFGGGSLFTDVEGKHACVLWAAHAVLAWLLRKPLILAFQGFGPFRTRWGECIARFAVTRARFVSLRDDASLTRARKWGVAEAVPSFDPVFSLSAEERIEACNKGSVAVVPRPGLSQAFLPAVLTWMRRQGATTVTLLSLQPDNPEEQRTCTFLASRIPFPVRTVQVRDGVSLLSAVASASSVFSARYHGAIAAMIVGRAVEVWPGAEGDKLSEVKRFIGQNPLTAKERARSLLARGEGALEDVLRSLLP